LADSPIHFGWQVSPYSAKTRAYLQHSTVPFKDVEPGAWTLWRTIQPAVGRIIMPTVRLPNGSWLQDSSRILDHFEGQPGFPPLYPPGPRQRLASTMLEVFGDEWLPMAALHYRWNRPENARFALNEFARSGAPWLPRILGRPLVRSFATRMQSYLPVLGVDGETIPAVEETVRLVLDALESHLIEVPFLFGGAPSMGDFSLFGPLWAHLYRDPASRSLFDDHPAVRRWMDALRTGETGHDDVFLPDDEVPEALDPLFACILTDQWAWIRQLVAAIDGYCEAHPGAKRVPRALGSAPFTIRGRQGERKLVTFVQWKAQRAVDAHTAAGKVADRWLDRVWAVEHGEGPRPPFVSVQHPFVLQGARAVLAEAARS